MPTVSFLFQRTADDEACQAAIEEVNRWAEVSAANFLKRGAKNPEVRRMAWAEVPDEGKLPEVLKRLQSLSVIETANRPARRTLIKPARKVAE
jgi:hypothetical protein